MKRNIFWGWKIAAALSVGVSSSFAGTVTYDFNNTFNGASPAGSAPWVQASFTDSGLPANTVQLTLSSVNLAANEYVNSWYFNLNPALNPDSLVFGSPTSVGSLANPTIKTGVNCFKADGDGKYDVLFTFATTGGASSLFGNGDSITFTITGINGLSADDFSFLSSPSAGSSGPFTSAARIVSGDQSGWVDPASTLHPNAVTEGASVPDISSTLPLLGCSLAALALFRKKAKA